MRSTSATGTVGVPTIGKRVPSSLYRRVSACYNHRNGYDRDE